MSPEQRLCERVLHLAGAAGVPPVVGLLLGQAVARYRCDTSPSGWAIARTMVLSVGGVLASFFGLAAMRYLAREGEASTVNATWFCASALAVSLGVGAVFVAAERLRRWRP